VGRKNYQPVKPKALARRIGVPAAQYADFRKALKDLVRQGRLELGKNHSVRAAAAPGTVAGTYRRTSTGVGFVKPHLIEGQPAADVRIGEGDELDAATGDVVLVRLTRKARGEF